MKEYSCIQTAEHEKSVASAQENMLKEEALTKMCGIFRILGEPSRMKIVLALLEGEMCVYHLTEICGGSFSSVSHQLRILRDNGIVKTRRIGKNIEYSIADEHVHEMVEMGKEHLNCRMQEED